MDPELKKKLLVGGGIAALLIFGVFVKNKWEEVQFKPLDRDIVLSIIKKSRKENYLLLKKVAAMAVNMSQQMRQISPQLIETYLKSPESPIRIPDEFIANQQKICKQKNVKYIDYQRSIDYFMEKEDKEIIHFIEEADKDFQTALSGKLAQPKVVVPDFLSKEKIIEIHRKITLKKYLIQIQMYRKLKGVPKERIAEDLELLKSLPNPEDQQEKILQDEGLGVNDDPPSAVFSSAVIKYRQDPNFTKQIIAIENDYKKIYNRYLPKIQQQTLTEDQINELEDELIYFQAGGF